MGYSNKSGHGLFGQTAVSNIKAGMDRKFCSAHQKFVYYSVSPFDKQQDKCGCVIKLHTKINSSLNLDNGVVIERYQGIMGH